MEPYEFDLMESTLRRLITEESDAVNSYMSNASLIEKNFPQAAYILRDLAKEERAHIGELQTLYGIIFPEYQQNVDEGSTEVAEKLKETVSATPTDVEITTYESENCPSIDEEDVL